MPSNPLPSRFPSARAIKSVVDALAAAGADVNRLRVSVAGDKFDVFTGSASELQGEHGESVAEKMRRLAG